MVKREDNMFRLPEGQRAEWNPDDNTVTLRNNDGEVIELNPSVFQKLGDWVHDKKIEQHQIYLRRRNKDHIVVDGDTLCHHNVRVPQNDDSEDLKPFPETTEREWRIILNTDSICNRCRDSATRADLIPSVPDGIPEFPCPECGEEVTKINRYIDTGSAVHDDGSSHKFDYDIYEEWRRGKNPEQIDSKSSRLAFR